MNDRRVTPCRYVERNPLRAGLVRQAWRWGSLWHREHDTGEGLLSAGAVPLPEYWVKQVNRVQSQAELEATRRSLQRGCPFGAPAWQERTANLLGLESTLRSRGRPAKSNPVPNRN